jgi:hypothetical protein
MSGVASPSGTPQAKQKRRALDDALQSEAFARADRLKKFLRYICEMEIEGKGDKISEYLVGVEALGRPEGFSPTEDSTVRTRAMALREKLQKLYETELRDAPVRIELQRGSYTPHFVEAAPASKAIATVQPPIHLAPVPAEPERRTGGRNAAIFALVAALGLGCGVLGYVAKGRSGPATVDAVIAEAWGPLARPDANALICVGAPPFFLVHGYPQFVSPGVLEHPVPGPPELAWPKAYRPPAPGKLTMHSIDGVAQIGILAGASACAGTLARFGSTYQILSERSVPVAALPRRNVFQFGSPEYSNNVSVLLERAPLTMQFDPVRRDFAVADRAGAKGGIAPLLPKRNERGALLEVYGLLTVMPSSSAPEGAFRTVVFSGTNSLGAQASAEFFSSPSHMRELRRELAKRGHDGFPPRYQVVLRCRTDSYQLISYQFESVRLFGP